MLVILLIILFGDFFKFGNLFGLTRYNWIQGHFSDLGLTAQVSTAIYYLWGHRRFGWLVSTLVPPVLFTLYELWQVPNHDLVDIVCYFLGSIVAVILIVLHKRVTDGSGEVDFV